MLDRLITPMVTPFNRYNRIDPFSLKYLLEHLIRTKTKTVVLASQLGEGEYLTRHERIELISKTYELSQRRLKIFVALTFEGTDRLKEEIKGLTDVSFDGYFIELPKDERINASGMKRHLKSVLAIIKKPVMIDLSGIERSLINDIMHVFITDPDLVGVICDDAELCRTFRELPDRSFRIYVQDTENIPLLLELGVDGIYSGLAHLYGETLHTLIQLYKKDQVQEAGLLWDVYQDKFRQIPSQHPSYMKAILNKLGYRVGNVRLPLTNLSPEEQQKLFKQLKI